MSAPSGEKQSKAKSKKSSMKGAKQHTKGKEATISDEKFRGDGVSFKCKLLGVSEVTGPRGDNMCIEAIKKLKQHIKQTGEHKQKIIFNVTLKGIRVFEEKTKNIMFEHPVSKVSFITHDPEDKKIFGYVSSSHCKTGHVMYAIKYDKVAGVITSTLYELFQVVFKLRQEAANQKRAQQVNSQPNPKANAVAVSNGPNTAKSTNEDNIYEEPNSTSAPVTEQANNADGHYKVPATRPLPPAPYASPTSPDSPQLSLQDDKTTNQLQSADSPAMGFSMPSDSFFSASVFTQADSASDTVSMSSVDIIRKESMSSTSSETASFDTRSLDLKMGHSASTPPTARIRPIGLTSPDVPSTENQAVPDENHDYETIPSSNYETIPNLPRTENKADAVSEFKGFNFKESFSEIKAFPRSDSLNDPFKSKDSKAQEDPSSEAFDHDDLFKCFGDSNFDEIALATSSSDFPLDDPFAPTKTTAAPQEPQSQTTDDFSSTDPFEAAFGASEMSPVSFAHSKELDSALVDAEKANSAEVSEEPDSKDVSSDRFEAAFGMGEMSPMPFQPVENLHKNNIKDLIDATWNRDAGVENENLTFEKEDKKSEKSEESKVEFKWDDPFGAKFDSENETGAQSKVKNEISWSTAFETKPQSEVNFSWDDAFATPKDSKDGQTKNDAGEVSFGDAFSSTPFKDSVTKSEPTFGDEKDSFSDFGNIALTPTVLELKLTKDNEVSGEISSEDSKVEVKEQGGSEEFQPKEISKEEDECKKDLADGEDLTSQSEKENSSKNEKPIPKIIEQTNEDTSEDPTLADAPRPISLPIQPLKPNQSEITSPNVPPPLPPRAKATLPVLPPRPRTISSPIAVNQVPPTPPRPTGLSGDDLPAPKGQAKRVPPALPPRVDLESEKTRANSIAVIPANNEGFNSNAFSSPINAGTSDSWTINWEEKASKDNNNKENLTNSKTSPDPFGDDFFTDFNFSAAKGTGIVSNEDSQSLFSDPFLSKEGADDMFKADFGGEDPFAGFTLNNIGEKNDPFVSGGDATFPGFSTSNDPFSDFNDPFAEKMAVKDDPFDTNPKKEESENIAFQFSKDSADEDFSDSFA